MNMKFVNKSTVFAIVFVLAHVTEAAVIKTDQRVLGGFPTTIAQFPFIVSVLRSGNLVTFTQTCVGSILTRRSVLSAAHCFRDSANRFRIRVGSSFANSGGVVHNVEQYTNHPDFRWIVMDNNISIVRTATTIVFVENEVQPAILSGYNYPIQDNLPVLVSGWNNLNNDEAVEDGCSEEQLHYTLIWTVNQQVCRSNYAELGFTITPRMICAGWPDVGGRGQCAENSGGPLIHHNESINSYVVIGVTSFNYYCGHPRYFGINSRVSNYFTWIRNNA